MTKRLIAALLIALSLLALTACGKTRVVHCDSCGREITVPESSNMTEDWIILCEECSKKVEASTGANP